MIVRNHQAEIIVVKRLIQGRNNSIKANSLFPCARSGRFWCHYG